VRGTERALITNAGASPAIVTMQALGIKGIKCYCADSYRAAGFYSRYCAARALSPKLIPNGVYLAWLERMAKKWAGAVIMPTNDVLMDFLADYGDPLSDHYRFLIPSPDSIRASRSKFRVMEMCNELGITNPRSLVAENVNHVEEACEILAFPIYMKPFVSSGGAGHHLARDKDELISKFKLMRVRDTKVLLQEYIKGGGGGLMFSAVFDKEHNPRSICLARRLRDVIHPTGGVGIHSFAVTEKNDEVVRQSVRIARHLKWRGAINVEWKESAENHKMFLIEINPRFYGGGKLPISVGVNHPWIYFALVTGRDFDDAVDYPAGHYWIRLFESHFRGTPPDWFVAYTNIKYGDLTISRLMRQYLRLPLRRLSTDVFDIRDPFPSLYLLYQSTPFLFGLLKKKLFSF